MAHEVAGVCCQVGQVRAVFRRDDEPELMAIVLAAIEEGVAIGAVLVGGIELAALAIARGSVALDIAQMGRRLAVLSCLLDVAGFHDDTAHSRRAVLPSTRQGARADEGRAASTLQARPAARPRCLAALGGG